MLEVQKYLKAHHTADSEGPLGVFEDLRNDYGIKPNFHPTLPLVILNYDQIESPKMEPIVRECRGLVLELGTYKVVAACMERFFNIGEALEITGNFDWESAESLVKEDGSLITLFNYKGEWLVKTRGSWADQCIGEGLPRWDELVMSLINPVYFDPELPASFHHECTYVFELCSPYNQVVRLYPEPKLFLLTVISIYKEGTYLLEWSSRAVDRSAKAKDLLRPARIDVKDEKAVRDYITKLEEEDGTAEGLVLKDVNNLRIKVKSSTYLAFSRLGNNGNIASDKNLIPLILANEQDEAIAIFPYIEKRVKELVVELDFLRMECGTMWCMHHELESQKDFALAVQKFPMSSLLFKNRKNGGDLKSLNEMFRLSADLLIRVITGD